ncbi:MAG: NIL domain-containing protein [Tolypothrix sp. Co-bin9]|nr:NIL domain-containing protein [Tolypothrix sp. Co-bin9]
MTIFNKYQLAIETRPSVISPALQKNNLTKVRLRLHIPQSYQQEPVISRLISAHGLIINITKAIVGENTDGYGCFDLELQGTPPQISSGLTYLESLNLTIKGKPNVDGDGWYC